MMFERHRYIIYPYISDGAFGSNLGVLFYVPDFFLFSQEGFEKTPPPNVTLLGNRKSI